MSTVIEDLLQKTSRTFALTIPLLPEPTRAEVGVAYLLFRIIDTFEDATRWPPERQLESLGRFVDVLDAEPAAAATLARALAADCFQTPPVDHAGCIELLARMPEVMEHFGALRPEARASLVKHVTRSADGMRQFVVRGAAPEGLELASVEELQAYCYAVAGIVGEMLTELFLLANPEMAPVAAGLGARAARFGEGLQLVNILKDAGQDEAEGRVYLPRNVDPRRVMALARRDLAIATEYTELLRAAGASQGVIAFNAFISKLAIANLRILGDRGLGAKLSRLEVARIAAEVAAEVRQAAVPGLKVPAEPEP